MAAATAMPYSALPHPKTVDGADKRDTHTAGVGVDNSARCVVTDGEPDLRAQAGLSLR